MCLILFATDRHANYPLVLAANRDEFYRRPTAPAGFWAAAPQVLAGRDLQGGGTWLGVTRGGRLAAVTNFRDPAEWGQARRSRGWLTRDFLLGDREPEAYLRQVARDAQRYKGFNLLVGIGADLWYFSNREGIVRRLRGGLHGLSNHLLDTAWPKVSGGLTDLGRLLAQDQPPSPAGLLEILADTSRPSDARLPDTGVGLDLERTLSSRFIVSPEYGTRCSTALLLARTGELTFVERNFGPDRSDPTERRIEFSIDSG